MFRSLMSQETTDIANNSEQLKKSPIHQLFFPCSSGYVFSSSLFVQCLRSHLQQVWFTKQYNKNQAPAVNTGTYHGCHSATGLCGFPWFKANTGHSLEVGRDARFVSQHQRVSQPGNLYCLEVVQLMLFSWLPR